MTSKDNSNNPPTISGRLKTIRKMLGISQKKTAENQDISAEEITVEEINQYENLKSQDISADSTTEIDEPKKYIVEIYDPTKNRLEARELDLFHFDGINLLFEEIKSTCNYVVEFCARIKPGGKIYDEFDKVYYEDNANTLEITNIKKVKSNDNS